MCLGNSQTFRTHTFEDLKLLPELNHNQCWAFRLLPKQLKNFETILKLPQVSDEQMHQFKNSPVKTWEALIELTTINNEGPVAEAQDIVTEAEVPQAPLGDVHQQPDEL